MKSVAHRLSSRISVSVEGCWEFSGSRNSKGYGWIKSGGRMMNTHRVSYSLVHGEESVRGRLVCHRCDNPCCVRPSHLFLASNDENMEDARLKGRLAKKLTRDQVDQIKARLRSGETHRVVAHDFEVSRENIGQISRGRIWRD